MKTIGAQRLYNAVKQGNTGVVILFLSSDVAGNFSYQKTFETWVEAGMKPDMLEALLQYRPFHDTYNRRFRRGTKNFDNEKFHFMAKLLEKMRDIIAYDSSPSVEECVKLKDISKIVAEEHEDALNNSSFSRALSEAVEKDKEWPWAIASVSRGLGFEVTTREYKIKEKQEEAIDWFLDMHGPVTAQDFENYALHDICRLVDEPDKFVFLERLIPDVELRTKFLEIDNYRIKRAVNKGIEGYKHYKALIKIAPWLEVKDGDCTDRNAVAEKLFNEMWDNDLQPNWCSDVLVQFPAIKKLLTKLCQ